MVKFEKDVENRVGRLLAMVCTEGTNPEAYEFVLKKLTRMSILGTAPPSCRDRNTAPTWSYESNLDESDDDFSARKESFIAP